MKQIYVICILLAGSSGMMAQQIDVESHTHDKKVIKSSTTGIQSWAIYGEAKGFNGKGVVGIASGNEGRGVYGSGEVGIYGSTSTESGKAGYFFGDVEIDGISKGLIFPDGSKQTTAFRDHNIFYRTQSVFLMAPNYSLSGAKCLCDAGDVVIGGGWDAVRNEQRTVHDAGTNDYYNRPISGGWEVGIRNNSGHYYFLTVFAICANVN